MFVEFIKAVGKEAGLTIHVEVHPVKRVIDMFARQEIDGYFPANQYTAPQSAVFSDVLFEKKVYAFSHRFLPLYTTEDLIGHSVGISLGYAYGGYVAANKKVLWETAKDDANNFQKLIKRRVDAVICEEATALTLIASLPVKDVVYDPARPLYGAPTRVAFQAGTETEKHLTAFNAAMKKLAASGMREKLMQAYFPNLAQQREELRRIEQTTTSTKKTNHEPAPKQLDRR